MLINWYSLSTVKTLMNAAPADPNLHSNIIKHSDIFCVNESEVSCVEVCMVASSTLTHEWSKHIEVSIEINMISLSNAGKGGGK